MMDIIDEINDDFYPNGRDYDSENEDWGQNIILTKR